MAMRKLTDMEFFNIQRGYIRRSDGSWIISQMASAADMVYHIFFIKGEV